MDSKCANTYVSMKSLEQNASLIFVNNIYINNIYNNIYNNNNNNIYIYIYILGI